MTVKSTEHELITSKRNPRIQRVHRLLSSKQFRDSEQCFIVEGVRLVEEAFRSGWPIAEFYYDETTNDRGREIVKEVTGKAGVSFRVSEDVVKHITDTENPQGIVAVLSHQVIPVPHEVELILILDAIRDPGNVGTILRTALAAGVDLVLIAPETSDPFSSKVLRSAMGAQLRIPTRILDWKGIHSFLSSKGIESIFLADMKGGKDLWNTDLTHPTALIISNEASGPSESARSIASGIVTIPMGTQSESLNAAIAASLLVYEVKRQRQAIKSI